MKEEIAKLDTEATSNDGTNVQVKVTEVDGKIATVNIATDTTASASDLTKSISQIKKINKAMGITVKTAKK